MKLEEVLKKSTEFLAAKGIESARLDTELLLAHGLKWARIDVYVKHDYPLNEEETQICRELIVRRGRGEPVAYITEHRGFYRYDFYVTPDVLIPRADTELVVEEALEWLQVREQEKGCIWDLGCGSGCVGLSLIKEKMGMSLEAFDISPKAIDVAKVNAINLSIDSQVSWHSGDLNKLDWSKFPQPDLIVANPPYIAEDDEELCDWVKEYEPGSALFSGDNGLSHLMSWGKKSLNVLPSGGLLLMECGYRQGEELKNFFSNELRDLAVEVVKDLTGKDRVLRVEVK